MVLLVPSTTLGNGNTKVTVLMSSELNWSGRLMGTRLFGLFKAFWLVAQWSNVFISGSLLRLSRAHTQWHTCKHTWVTQFPFLPLVSHYPTDRRPPVFSQEQQRCSNKDRKEDKCMLTMNALTLEMCIIYRKLFNSTGHSSFSSAT